MKNPALNKSRDELKNSITESQKNRNMKSSMSVTKNIIRKTLLDVSGRSAALDH